MYKLYTRRVISSTPCEICIGEYDSLAQCTRAIHSCGFYLSAYVIGPNGERYKELEVEYFDTELEADCVSIEWERE